MIEKRVYFDNAATTPLAPRVLEKMLPYLEEHYGNASSIHSYGRKARVAVEEARETIAKSINAEPGEIYFVSGGTEANNFPLLGIARLNKEETKRKGIITTKAEHLCVLETSDRLTKEGFSVEKLDVNRDSILDEETLAAHLDDNVSLVSAIHVNNETASVNNIKELCRLAHNAGALFHTDMVQSFGKIKTDVKELEIDSMSIASHKINGPKGAGAVYIKSGTPVLPIIYGGAQERNRRGGTEDVAAIAGFAEAVKIASAKMDESYISVSRIRNFIISGLKHIDSSNIKVNCEDSPFPYILSFTMNGKAYNNDAEAILMYLDINGVAASNGAACSSGALKPSHVILSMGIDSEDARGTIRLSFGPQNTMEEAEYFLEVFSIMARKFRV
jgi:cysteine desulfurase